MKPYFKTFIVLFCLLCIFNWIAYGQSRVLTSKVFYSNEEVIEMCGVKIDLSTLNIKYHKQDSLYQTYISKKKFS